MKNEIQERLLELVQACQKFQKDILSGNHLHIDGGDDFTTVSVFNCPDHSSGLNMMRLIGGKQAEKASFDPETPWHSLSGILSVEPKVYFKIFCQGLPPMCKVESYEEEIPKEQVIQTGEKTVVRRTRILCGEGK
jgi:hypothetical protein